MDEDKDTTVEDSFEEEKVKEQEEESMEKEEVEAKEPRPTFHRKFEEPKEDFHAMSEEEIDEGVKDEAPARHEHPHTEMDYKEMEQPRKEYADFSNIKHHKFDTDEDDSSYHQRISQPLHHTKKSSNKTTIILIVILILILAAGFGLLKGRKAMTGLLAHPTPTPSPTETPAPTPTPNPLIKSDWSLEVVNGTTQSGLAKKIGDQIAALGYPVVKVGNADKQNYDKTQILVKKGMEDKVDLVIADLKDVIKIASFGGELKEGTASARIIIGKDSL